MTNFVLFNSRYLFWRRNRIFVTGQNIILAFHGVFMRHAFYGRWLFGLSWHCHSLLTILYNSLFPGYFHAFRASANFSQRCPGRRLNIRIQWSIHWLPLQVNGFDLLHTIHRGSWDATASWGTSFWALLLPLPFDPCICPSHANDSLSQGCSNLLHSTAPWQKFLTVSPSEIFAQKTIQHSTYNSGIIVSYTRNTLVYIQ